MQTCRNAQYFRKEWYPKRSPSKDVSKNKLPFDFQLCISIAYDSPRTRHGERSITRLWQTLTHSKALSDVVDSAMLDQLWILRASSAFFYLVLEGHLSSVKLCRPSVAEISLTALSLWYNSSNAASFGWKSKESRMSQSPKRPAYDFSISRTAHSQYPVVCSWLKMRRVVRH